MNKLWRSSFSSFLSYVFID